MRNRRTLLAAALLAAVPVATAVSAQEWGQEWGQEWRQSGPGYAWEFPRDHWAHEGYRTEWWYFVGFAETPDGSRRFAWQFTLFRAGLTSTVSSVAPSQWGARHVAMGHAAVADLSPEGASGPAGGLRAFAQTTHREAPGLARFGEFPNAEIGWMLGPPGTPEAWGLTFRDGAFRFTASDARSGLRLELTADPTRPPLFHGEGGFSPKSEGGAGSAYYSHPRLRVRGVLGLGGSDAEVTGTGWMDREFGSNWLAPDQTGWDWFALNLDDGRDLMLYLLRRRDGSLAYRDGTVRGPESAGGRRVRNAAVEVLDTWMPPDLAAFRVGAAGSARPYPAGWRIQLPDEGLDLTVRPLLADQENRRPPGGAGPDIPYWEGAVAVETEAAGRGRIRFGRGFVELTGYRSEVSVATLVSDGFSDGGPDGASDGGPDTIGPAFEARQGRRNTMMDGLMDGVTFLFRWLHIFVGIIWIGHLYFFNFVNAQMTAKLDGATKQKVVPELMPRALYWFRWGAAWTWITGFVLLLLVFWHGGLMFDPGDGWGGGAIAMVVITFVGVFVYDALWSSGLKSNLRAATIVSFLLLAVTVFLFVEVGAFTPRAVLIHTGALFGTMMAFNVWFRIWPAQQRIIAAVKAGKAPAAADPALAGLRSKHNTYMSLPLLWAMANEHATPFFGGNFGIPGDYYWVAWLVVVAIAWHVIFQCYRIAGRVSGM